MKPNLIKYSQAKTRTSIETWQRTYFVKIKLPNLLYNEPRGDSSMISAEDHLKVGNIFFLVEMINSRAIK